MREIDNDESGLKLYKVEIDDWEEIDLVLAKTGVVSNFTCFPQLWAFAVKPPTNGLHLCEFQGTRRLVLHRQGKALDGSPVNDIRIFFSRRSEDDPFIEAIKTKFHLQYVGYNLIPENEVPPDYKDAPVRNELIINLDYVAGLQDKELRRSYGRCQRRHPNLRYIDVLPEHRPLILQFLDEWCQTESIVQNLGPDLTAENDRRFIDYFLESQGVKGGIVFDGDRLVGIAFHTYHPSNPKDLAVKVILKNHRGYTKLGQWLMVEEARQLQKEGYIWALMGGDEVPSQKAFKEQFMTGGRRNTYYAREVFRQPNLSLPENYLRDIWA